MIAISMHALATDDAETLSLQGSRLSQGEILLAKLLFGPCDRLDFYDILATYLDRSVRQASAQHRGSACAGRF
jgi:hypothetical protein